MIVQPAADTPTTPGEAAGERLYSLEEALELAQTLHRSGHLEPARQIYAAVLAQRPDHPDTLHFLGILEHQRGDSEASIALIRRAIDAMPGEPGPWNNLGNVFVETGRLDEATAAYRHCLELAPEFTDALNNLGSVWCARGDWAESEACYRRALELRPDFVDSWNNLAKLMVAQRRIREGVTYACKAITLMPRDPDARKLLGMAYYTLGEIDKAGEVYREWLAEEPDNPIARHHLAACTGEAVPARASDDYVARTFDAFADSFDAKLERLSYRAPQLVAQALAAAGGEPAAALAVLDAGCGTGLCGPLLRAHARVLVGVDLSERMLGRARQRAVYDTLVQGELVGFLQAQAAVFDVIVSADTLCYFGELDGLARTAQAALRAGGCLLFTVEALAEDDDAPFRLHAHGRYAHAGAYVRNCLEAAGLHAVTLAPEVLRREGGLPVNGWLVAARKPGPASQGVGVAQTAAGRHTRP